MAEMVVKQGRFAIHNKVYETDEIFELTDEDLKKSTIQELINNHTISYLKNEVSQ